MGSGEEDVLFNESFFLVTNPDVVRQFGSNEDALSVSVRGVLVHRVPVLQPVMVAEFLRAELQEQQPLPTPAQTVVP